MTTSFDAKRVAVVERLDHRLRRAVCLGEDLAQVGDRLLRPAQDPAAAREHLHGHDRVELLGAEDRAGALEVHIGRLAGEHVRGGQEVRGVAARSSGAAVYDVRRRTSKNGHGQDEHDRAGLR